MTLEKPKYSETSQQKSREAKLKHGGYQDNKNQHSLDEISKLRLSA